MCGDRRGRGVAPFLTGDFVVHLRPRAVTPASLSLFTAAPAFPPTLKSPSLGTLTSPPLGTLTCHLGSSQESPCLVCSWRPGLPVGS